MRPSKRTAILDAAHRVVLRDGLSAVTYEAVADEAGLTKGGVVYHFASREDLIIGMSELLAARWDASMTAAAGAPAEQLTERARVEIYARESIENTTNAELKRLIESADIPAARAAWSSVVDRWALSRVDDPPTDEQLELLVLRLAADGLWIYDSIAGDPMDQELRRQLVERIALAIRTDSAKPVPQ